MRLRFTADTTPQACLRVDELIEVLQNQDPTLPVLIRREGKPDLEVVGVRGSSAFEPTEDTDDVLYLILNETI